MVHFAPPLRFGTSGVPHSSPRPTTEAGIRRAAELGLTCFELPWGNGIRMGKLIKSFQVETGL